MNDIYEPAYVDYGRNEISKMYLERAKITVEIRAGTQYNIASKLHFTVPTRRNFVEYGRVATGKTAYSFSDM